MKLIRALIKPILYYVLLFIKGPFNFLSSFLHLGLFLGVAASFVLKLEDKFNYLLIAIGISFLIFILKKFYDKILYWLNPEYKSSN